MRNQRLKKKFLRCAEILALKNIDEEFSNENTTQNKEEFHAEKSTQKRNEKRVISGVHKTQAMTDHYQKNGRRAN